MPRDCFTLSNPRARVTNAFAQARLSFGSFCYFVMYLIKKSTTSNEGPERNSPLPDKDRYVLPPSCTSKQHALLVSCIAFKYPLTLLLLKNFSRVPERRASPKPKPTATQPTSLSATPSNDSSRSRKVSFINCGVFWVNNLL